MFSDTFSIVLKKYSKIKKDFEGGGRDPDAFGYVSHRENKGNRENREKKGEQ